MFPAGEYVFGRGAECHIRPNSDWVSRQHCLLRVAAEATFIRDLGSRNGTLVNGERVIGERRLVEGDRLQVGPLVFEFHTESGTHNEAAEDTINTPSPTKDDTAFHCMDTAELPPLQPDRERPSSAEIYTFMPPDS
jgi:pSer/pThr/pTyr-binding forkhead associated (FHA) protein